MFCTEEACVGEVGVGKIGSHELGMLKVSTLEAGVVEVSHVADQITVKKHPTRRKRCRSTPNSSGPHVDESGTFEFSALQIAAGKRSALGAGVQRLAETFAQEVPSPTKTGSPTTIVAASYSEAP
jgi:hypothetical protein